MEAFLIYAIATTICGCIPWINLPFRIPRKWFVIIIILNFVLGLFTGYLATPGFYGPFWGMSTTFLLVGGLNFILNLVAHAALEDESSLRFFQGRIAFVVGTIIILITAFAGSSIFRAEDYRNLLGEVEDSIWEKDESPIDIHHIRVISKEQAEWLGNKIIGEAPGALGSQYTPGQYTIQRINGELWWVAPLEFRGFFKWINNNYSPGWVMVSAEDRTTPPRLIVNHKLYYMPSAYFSKNLTRHIYTSGYYTLKLTDYTFELDENLNPYWVITVVKPTITYFGDVVEGVLIVNPETGEIKYYTVGEVPDWVDRVYPEELVENYLTWYGRYVKGWLNALFSEENVEVPTIENVGHGRDKDAAFLVWGSKDNQAYWFTGITSSSRTDQSLTGLMMVNSRTGKAKRYRVTGPNEAAVVEAVNNAVSNFKGWHGTQPILYNIGGEKTWVVPVISENHILQKIALVNLSNALVALGGDIEEAIKNYRAMLAKNGKISPSPLAHKIKKERIEVTRIGSEIVGGKTLYYLYFNAIPEIVFTVTTDISPEVPITQPGEKVTISYIDTGEPLVQIIEFDNENLQVRSHKSQSEQDTTF